MALRNDKGRYETSPCSFGFCSWDDVQSWSRELDKRRDRAFVLLRSIPEPDWTAAQRQLASWANDPRVVANSGLSDQTGGGAGAIIEGESGFGEERVEEIIGQIKDGDIYLRNAGSPIIDRPDETGTPPMQKALMLAFVAGIGYIALKNWRNGE